MYRTIEVNDTLKVEWGQWGDGRYYARVVRADGGLVSVWSDEVKALVAALTEAGARIAAEAAGVDYVGTDDLW